MALTGVATIAPAVILPVWFEYLAGREAHAAAVEKLATLEQRLESIRRQSHHLKNDAAYILRMAQQELGVGPLGAPWTAAPGPTSVEAATPEGEEWIPDLSAYVDQTLARFPRLRIFVREDTRPIVLLLGGTLLAAALILLGRNSAPRPTRADEGTAPGGSLG